MCVAEQRLWSLRRPTEIRGDPIHHFALPKSNQMGHSSWLANVRAAGTPHEAEPINWLSLPSGMPALARADSLTLQRRLHVEQRSEFELAQRLSDGSLGGERSAGED